MEGWGYGFSNDTIQYQKKDKKMFFTVVKIKLNSNFIALIIAIICRKSLASDTGTTIAVPRIPGMTREYKSYSLVFVHTPPTAVYIIPQTTDHTAGGTDLSLMYAHVWTHTRRCVWCVCVVYVVCAH